jgi:uncharacterized RDD family membrane protein YckC
VSANVLPDRDIRLQGHYAGAVSRAVAYAVDTFVVSLLYVVGAAGVEYLLTVLGWDIDLADRPWLTATTFAVWSFTYFAYPLSVSGRTLGMAVVGVRVVRADGHALGAARAVVRVLVLPLSFLLFGLGLLLILLRRDRRALHDLIAGSAVVYAWDAQAARLRFLAQPDHP